MRRRAELERLARTEAALERAGETSTEAEERAGRAAAWEADFRLPPASTGDRERTAAADRLRKLLDGGTTAPGSGVIHDRAAA
ncbi:hypothetical protein [Streptomyces sp. NPDC001717]|uniref:hypothetical protein n=1 Tax=Streptomyces sp. NPDC001717 TaxID=3364604 RepID=UPI003683776A